MRVRPSNNETQDEMRIYTENGDFVAMFLPPAVAHIFFLARGNRRLFIALFGCDF